MDNILQLLEKQSDKNPDKAAFSDEKQSFTYRQTEEIAKSVGTALIEIGAVKAPVLLLMDKSAAVPIAMLGVLEANSFYVVLDAQQPVDRMEAIAGQMNAAAVITTRNYSQTAEQLAQKVFFWEDISVKRTEDTLLKKVRRNAIDTDLAYVLFTSGSTGIPKGVAITHRNVLSYSEWFAETFRISEKNVFGNQTPFYFSMSVTDIFGTLRGGAEMVVIPKKLFGFPIQLLEYMTAHRVNTIYWVPSALGIAANWDALRYVEDKPSLSLIMFAGEVMPTVKYNYWKKYYPDAVFANLFGPTETTDICTYYIVDREFSNEESFPIGYPCKNCGAIVVNESGALCGPGEQGELYVSGSFLAKGYYGLPEKTAQIFVQSPLHNLYDEKYYRTGDLVYYDENNCHYYCGRKDHQIKRHGFRIEIGEIEAAGAAIEAISECACIYLAEGEQLIFFYSGKKGSEESLFNTFQKRLPHYMIPTEIHWLRALPHNANGKIDRSRLMADFTAG